MIKIEKITNGSNFDLSGIKVGDKIISLNGKKINDKLDFAFHSVNFPLSVILKRNDEIKEFLVEDKNDNEESGAEVAEMKLRHCGNDCVFCFVSQLPKGMRKTLYEKDEDFRYSFLYGNYFTFTNTTWKDLDRIIEQKMTPLYVSIHAVDPDIRHYLLGKKVDGSYKDDYLDKMKYLTDNGIQLHTQIVMCPDINDGKVLKETIEKMYSFFPQVISLSIVPLGKTKYRKSNHLPELRSVTKEDAEKAIDLITEYQQRFLEESGTNFAFAADEFYLKAGRNIPEDEHYESYEQYENGIGMVRDYLERLKKENKYFPKSIKHNKQITLITGKLFAPILKDTISPILKKIKKLEFEILPVENKHFGEEITVAGLLTGKDVIAAIKDSQLKTDLIILPDTCLNYNSVFLDNLSLKDLEDSLQTKIIQFSNFKTLAKEIGNC